MKCAPTKQPQEVKGRCKCVRFHHVHNSQEVAILLHDNEFIFSCRRSITCHYWRSSFTAALYHHHEEDRRSSVPLYTNVVLNIYLNDNSICLKEDQNGSLHLDRTDEYY